MKPKFKHIVDRLFSFRKAKNDEPAPEPAPNPDPPELDGTILASNVLRGTNPDLTLKTACQGSSPETPAPAEIKPARQNRDCHVKIRFTESELAEVKQKAAEAGLDCSKYIRAKLNAAELLPTPEVDAAALRLEVNRVGRRIDDIRARANATGFIDVPELRKTLAELSKAQRAIITAFTIDDRSGQK